MNGYCLLAYGRVNVCDFSQFNLIQKAREIERERWPQKKRSSEQKKIKNMLSSYEAT